MQAPVRFVSRLAACIAAALAFTTAAQAHSQWLLPSVTVLSKGQYVSFDGAISTRVFDIDFVPLNVDGLVITAPDGSAVAPENLLRARLRSVFDVNMTQPGTYRVAVLSTGFFASYKDAAGQQKRWRGARDGLATAIPADATDLRVTESLGRVETFVTVGKPSSLQPTNQGLELAPVTAPNDLAVGDAATFALLLDGKPAAGVEVELIRGGGRWRDKVDEIKLVTDAAGRFTVKWPEAGMYYLEAQTRDAKTSTPQAQERRATYGATLEVLP